MNTEIPRFFMGTSTKNGFIGFPKDLYISHPDAHAFLIKSGPGTGKSTLMRSLAAMFRENGELVEEYTCSSDPDSLDGIHLPARHVCVFDATAPHVLEPEQWGIKEEIVSLGDALNPSLLSAKRETINNTKSQNAAAHARARRYLTGACAAFEDRGILSARARNDKTIQKIASRLVQTELTKPTHPVDFSGEQRRFLSAVTPKGFCTYSETVSLLCPRILLLDDPFSAAAPALLNELCLAAAKRDLPRILCPHPLSQSTISHLLFPSLGTAFVTADRTFSILHPSRTLHLRRAYDETVIAANKNRAAFDKKVEREMILAATEALKNAKEAHDLLESPYKSAMNFEKIDSIKTALYQRILGFPAQK